MDMIKTSLSSKQDTTYRMNLHTIRRRLEPRPVRARVGRQQFLVRRLIGVGVGLGFLILIVIAFRGCLEARSDRALRNYSSSVASIMQQSEQSGKSFFDLLNSPS